MESNNNQSDHDLLIRLDTKLSTVITDIKDLRDGFSARLAVVEQNKMEKAEAMHLKHDEDNAHKDYEQRLRRLERWGWIAAGALIVIQFIISSILTK